MTLDVRRYDIALEPISVNHAYPPRRYGGGRFLTKEAKLYKEFIKEVCESQDRHRDKFTADFIELGIVLWYPLQKDRGKGQSILYKNGKMRRLDPSNMCKLIEDAISDYLGIDDTYNISVHLFKRISKTDNCLITVLVSETNLNSIAIYRGESIQMVDRCL